MTESATLTTSAAPGLWHGRRAILDLDDFTRDELETTLAMADRMREVLNSKENQIFHAFCTA